jgi:putative oxidoreductase
VRALVIFGRAFFSLIFIMSSFKHFDGSMVGYAAGAGVPIPEVMVPLSGALALLGGLSVFFGVRPRAGGWLLIGFLVPVTVMMHRFWGLDDPQAAMQQQIHFMKNLSMLGGAMLIAAFGANGSTAPRLRRPAREVQTPVAIGER